MPSIFRDYKLISLSRTQHNQTNMDLVRNLNVFCHESKDRAMLFSPPKSCLRQCSLTVRVLECPVQDTDLRRQDFLVVHKLTSCTLRISKSLFITLWLLKFVILSVPHVSTTSPMVGRRVLSSNNQISSGCKKEAVTVSSVSCVLHQLIMMLACHTSNIKKRWNTYFHTPSSNNPAAQDLAHSTWHRPGHS